MDDSILTAAMAAFRRAIGLCGTQVEFERRTGLRQQTVSNRLKNNIPLRNADEVMRVEKATGVPRHELRPDLYPLDNPPASEGDRGKPLHGLTA